MCAQARLFYKLHSSNYLLSLGRYGSKMLLLGIVVTHLSGCGEPKTKDLKISFQIESSPNIEQTSATLYFYDGTQELILDKATLSIKAKGIAQTMLKHDSRSTKSYSASFDFSNTNEMFTLSIFRADYEDAPNTFVTGPSPVVINSPLDQSTQDGNAAYELQWSPSIEGESLDYWTLIYCQHPTNGITEWKASRDEKLIPDTGTYTIDFSAWFIQESIAPEWQCNAQTWLARETQGTLDPALNPNGNAIARYFHVISYDISH